MIASGTPDIQVLEETADGTYGKIVVEPLERGFGTTLGNSMRRVLLSSLPGVAATSIKIDGVLHEFSTIPGVKEDVTEIVLNIKGLLARIEGSGPKTIYIEKEGEGEVTAADLQCDSEVTILNPDMHIATLCEGASLNAKIVLEEGRGYVSAERNKEMMKPVIGVIPLDSIYTPVVKVNYAVESMRVGQSIDFDKLTLEVWTNGVLNYREAVSVAAQILENHFDLFIDLSDNSRQVSSAVQKITLNEPDTKHINMSLEELNMSARAFNCLKRAGINTLDELLSRSERDLKKIRNMGQKSFGEVLNRVQLLGYQFKADDED